MEFICYRERNPSCDWVDMHDVLRDELNSLSEISGVQWNESTNELYSRVLNHWDIIAFLDQVLSDPVYYERVKEILQTLEMVYNSDWAKCPPHEKDRPLKNGLLTISVG
ncbi:hypothetical protein FRC03_003822 [Tulasnella sp. 419]|nr:hypothetical protein FRC03_003822 [Tulasnella sp. 419]